MLLEFVVGNEEAVEGQVMKDHALSRIAPDASSVVREALRDPLSLVALGRGLA